MEGIGVSTEVIDILARVGIGGLAVIDSVGADNTATVVDNDPLEGGASEAEVGEPRGDAVGALDGAATHTELPVSNAVAVFRSGTCYLGGIGVVGAENLLVAAADPLDAVSRDCGHRLISELRGVVGHANGIDRRTATVSDGPDVLVATRVDATDPCPRVREVVGREVER